MTGRRRFSASVAMVALVAGCGGGSGSGGPSGTAPPSTPPPTAGCTLAERQAWVLSQLNEWYLFPESLATGVNPGSHSNIDTYVDALVAPARALSRDRFFTYVTSITEENAFFNSGASAGFGIRLSTDVAARRLLIAEAFEGAPGLAAGIDRGTEILAIGTSNADLRTVDAIIAAEGSAGVTNALGPADAGVTRLLRIRDAAGTRDVSVTKAVFSITPVSSRYGAQIINDGGRRVGYVNLRTFINTADPALRAAFNSFRGQGITEVIVDFRYNGGGLVSIAELMNDLILARPSSSVQGFTTFRSSKASRNETTFFSPQPQSINGMRVAFIGTGSSASASELVMNAALPYLGTNAALIGSNTFGKPVGQIALDRAACDDRLRVVAFATQNANRQGDYFTGLASKFQSTCRAADDVTRPLGDPNEASTRAALDFLAGRACTTGAISDSGGGGISQRPARAPEARELLTPDRPTTPQREIPGFF